MATVIRAQQGQVVPIRYTVRSVRNDNQNGERSRVNGCTISIIKPDGSTLANPPEAVFERKGSFVVYFDTNGLPLGDYKVVGDFGLGFDTVQGTVVKTIRRSIFARIVVTL